MASKTKSKSAAAPRFRQSKSEDFLDRIREHNPMIEYFSALTIMNPASTLMNQANRNGAFVRLAHAKEEFVAPIITKGKSASRKSSRMKRDLNRV